MDRTYIQDQNIVQRYLSGDLSLREAREFEKLCLENPDILEALPIPIRLKAKLARHPMDDQDLQAALQTTSLDISNGDEDDDDDTGSPSRWQGSSGGSRTGVMVLSIALIAAIGGIVALLFAMNTQQKEMQKVVREAKAVQLQPPGNIQQYRTLLSETKPSAPTINIGAPNPARFIDLTVDVSKEAYNTYLVTIDDVTRGRVMQIHRLARDSNKELRLKLNSSAFGAGDYDLQFEGYTWRGETEPVGWVRLGIK